MAYCTYTDVRRIITTDLADADLTALIVLADEEIDVRLLNTRSTNIKKRISMYLTADMAVNTDPPMVTVGGVTIQSHRDDSWRRKAEAFILNTGDLPIEIKNDPLPNE